jgi:hypothetical protein
MLTRFIFLGRYRVRRLFQTQFIASCSWSIALFLLAVAILVFIQLTIQVESLEFASNEVYTQAQEQRPVNVQLEQDRSVLPFFDSAALTDSLQQISLEEKLKLDEISYSLDSSPTQPYLRYRTTLLINAKYPNIRHFVDQVRRKHEQTSLDSISCKRGGIDDVELICELSISAFYRRKVHG